MCKAVELELSALLDAAAPEWKVAEERIAAEGGRELAGEVPF